MHRFISNKFTETSIDKTY